MLFRSIDAVQTYASGGKLLLVEHGLYSSASGGGGAKTGGTADLQAQNLGLFLLPTDTVAITAQNVSGDTNVTVRTVLNWEELF